MSASKLWALLLTATLALAGCLGDSDKDSEEDHCDDGHMDEDCPSQSGHPSGSPTPTTPPTPNDPPILVLAVTDDNGTATDFVMEGGNLTFSAAGSSDPDGSIEGIAVSVQDSNTTRTGSLYDVKKNAFTPFTVNLAHPGVVNVTVAMIDDRGAFATNNTQVFVNDLQGPFTVVLKSPAPATVTPTTCAGTVPDTPAASGDILNSNFYKEFDFEVLAGATYVEAILNITGPAIPATDATPAVILGDADMAICGPDGAISEVSGPGTVLSSPDTNFTAGGNYSVAVVGQFFQTEVSVSVVVHYEARPAA